jgi:hypothetical protein
MNTNLFAGVSAARIPARRIVMNRKLVGWLMGATLLATAAWLRPAQAIEHVLVATTGTDNFNCLAPGSGNLYYAESWGYDGGNNKICEISHTVQPFTVKGIGLCAGPFGALTPPVKHRAAITIRTSTTRAVVSTVRQDTAPVALTASSSVTYTQGAQGSCPAVTIDAESDHYEIPDSN